MKTPNHVLAALRASGPTRCSLLALVVLGLALMAISGLGPRSSRDANTQSPAPTLGGNQTSLAPLPEGNPPAVPVLLSLAAQQSDDPADAAVAQPLVRSNPLAAPEWAVPYGKEFWRTPAAPVAADPKRSAAPNLPGTLNVGDVIERVRHALAPDDAAAAPHVAAQTYAASFDGQGLVFSPHRPGAGSADALSPSDERDGESRLETGVPDRQRSPDVREPGEAPQADPATQLCLRTLGIQQGNVCLYAAKNGTAEWSYLGNTAQALLNRTAGLVEHHELRGDGAHLTWVLGQKPAGAGPVTIAVEAVGLGYAGQTEKGQHFADASGTPRVCVGAATAVDAAGRTWPLAVAANPGSSGHAPVQTPFRARRSTLSILIPSAILTEATYPLAIDPIVSPEFGIDNPVTSPALTSQYSPAVAQISADLLVVWTDYRNYGSRQCDIYGARVNYLGAVLDPAGIAISTRAGNQIYPSVAANYVDWLVVWEDWRNDSGSFTTTNCDIYGARVNGGGVVLNGSGLSICKAAGNQYHPSVAASGTNWLVVWEDERNYDSSDWDIYGARVSDLGTVVDTNGFAICLTDNRERYPSVAAGETNWLVVWTDDRNSQSNGDDIYGARVNSDGSVLESGGFAIGSAAGSQHSPAVAAGGTNWLVVWQDGRGGGWDIYGARVNFDGTLSDTNGLAISTAANSQDYPSVSANYLGDWLVVWEDDRSGWYADIYGARISSDGTVLDGSGLAICTAGDDQEHPCVAAGWSDWLVVWQDRRGSSDYDIYGARVNFDGTLSDTSGLAISTVPYTQYNPAVAGNGINWLVVWEDDRNLLSANSGYDIYGARVNSSGTVLDPGGRNISRGFSYERSPSVAAIGTNWLVVWEDGRNEFADGGIDIYGARVRGSGTVLDGSGLAICTVTNDQMAPCVAALGTDWLVVWEDQRNKNSTGWDICGTLVSSNGTVLEINGDTNGFPISTATDSQLDPSVAANGMDWLVVWQDGRSGSHSDIYGARVSSIGWVSETDGLPIGSGSLDQRLPSVAASGTDWLVVWQENPGDGQYDIYGARVDGSGTVLDSAGLPVCTATNSQEYPAVAANGTEWQVVWQNRRNGSSWDIYGARVNSSGEVLDTNSIAVNVKSGDQRNPAIADLKGQFLVVYDGPAESGFRRIRANTIAERVEIQRLDGAVILTWNNPDFALQSAPAVTGVFTNVPGATSPWTSPTTGDEQFFRLKRD